MQDLNSVTLVLWVGIHMVITAISTGDLSKAITICVTSITCFLLIIGAIWIKEKVLPQHERTNHKPEQKHEK